MSSPSSPFDDRIGEGRVSEILRLIAERPNQRDEPLEGDVAGEFDYWFDGGACKIHTGTMYYRLQDGTEVHSAMPAPWLNLNIVFTDGNVVDVVQRRRTDAGEYHAGAIQVDRLQGGA